MKTLILSSSGERVFSEEVEKELPQNFNNYKIAYIITAGKRVDDTRYIDKRREEMKSKNLIFTEIDIAKYTEGELREELLRYSMIYIEGGNTFYLLQQAIRTNLEGIIKSLLKRGVIYMSSSAGTYLACPGIEMALLFTHNFDRCGTSKYEAMDLVDFYVKAHYDGSGNENKDLADFSQKLERKIYALSDSQVIIIKDNELKILGGEVKIF